MKTPNNVDEPNVDSLNKEISDVHQIMAENINLIIDRERAIKSISSLSENIKDDSGKFKKLTYETRMKMLLQKYSILIAIVLILILIVIFKVYL